MKRKLKGIGLVALLLAGIVSLCLPVCASAKTVGVIMTGDIPYYQKIHNAFVEGMAGQGVEIVVQKPVPNPMSWANAAKKLVVIGADVIVSYGAPATLTTMKVTSDIPIIFAGVYDPKAMNITGKNATGISSTVSIADVIKKLQEITEFKKLGVIFSKAEKDTILQVREIKGIEGSLGFETVLFNVTSKVDKAGISNINALLFTASCSGMYCINEIVEVARRDRIPTAATIGGGEENGVILTIAAAPEEQGRGVAEMVKKVLNGANPSQIPVKEPGKVEMIVNVKEARAIGLKVPPALISSATRVIE